MSQAPAPSIDAGPFDVGEGRDAALCLLGLTGSPYEIRRGAPRYGRIAVKVVFDPEGRATFSAEVDDCVRAARKQGAPLRVVVRVAVEAARR